MLIVNPFATATSPAGRDALVNTLGSHVPVDVEHTTHRGHAGELAVRAARHGYDVVVVHGGDGSVNEVANGLLGPPAATARNDDRPALAIIPGGSANVFARTLGIEADPLRATRQLIDLLDKGAVRRIGLGCTNDRWFLFNAGMGIDAIVVHAMENKRDAGRRATAGRYLWTTVASFLRHSASPLEFRVEFDGHAPIDDVRFAFVSNTTPWTFLGNHEIRTNPNTDFGSRLGVFASTSVRILPNLPVALRLLAHRPPRGRRLIRDDDVAWVRMRADEPVDVQMDGDYIGAFTEIDFGHRRDVLDVVAPIPAD
ncbi:MULTISPECIES: diacylglycerol/lipid kinase family protein [unclassified Gordonia (in: high G+C Gram-positive bacteria)]